MKPLKKIEESEQEETQEVEKPKFKQANRVRVTVQEGEAFELETGEVVDANEILLRIYNKILKIERSVA
jgi:predicted transcriptional regulator